MISSYWNTMSSMRRPTNMSRVSDGADTTAESRHWQRLHPKEDEHSTAAQLFTGADSRPLFCLRWRWKIRRCSASSLRGFRRLRLSFALEQLCARNKASFAQTEPAEPF